MVLHHDDPPCRERLEPNGDCKECGVHPDMQSTCFYFYCQICGIILKKMKCSECGRVFEHPNHS